MQGLVEAPLYRGLVAGELGEGVRLVRISNEGLPERSGFGVSHGLKLSGFGRGLSVFLFVGDDGSRKILGGKLIVRTLGPGVGASLPSSPLGQFSIKLEGENIPASTRPRRCSLLVEAVIRSTSRPSSSPSGCSSSRRRSPSSFRVASSSPGRRTSRERRPCLRPWWRTAAFPSGVFGPVLFEALRRLACACLSLVMVSPFRGSCANGIREIVVEVDPATTLDFKLLSGYASTRGRNECRVQSVDSRIVPALCCMLTVVNGAHC